MHALSRLALSLLLAAGGACTSAGDATDPAPRIEYTEERAPCADYRPERQALFGELHVHTGMSFDARGYDVRALPADAYRFARGEPYALPPFDASGQGSRVVQLDRPLDFAAVTDHQEFLGEIQLCLDPDSEVYAAESCEVLRGHTDSGVSHFGMRTADPDPARLPDLCGTADCTAAAVAAWQSIQEAAEAAYDRTASCEFVSFVGYEYTNSGNVTNRHRNVFFRNDQVPTLPPSYFEAQTPAELRAMLQSTCLEAGTGCDALIIPHNSNWSNGNQFVVEYPDARTPADEPAAAALRARLEPLVEIFQHKGEMECSNELEGVTPDPLCDFERERVDDWSDCGDTPGFGGVIGMGCMSRLDFVRHVLLAGLVEEARLGVNPYRLGVIAATDGHNAIPGFVDEATWRGHVGLSDDTAEERLGDGNMTHRGIVNNPGGLAGVWAEERSRDAIWEALQRRETFATTGPRLTVRLFAGWDVPADLCDQADPADRATQADRHGVPMGADLPTAPTGASAPTLAVWAGADLDGVGTPLQRLQIIKGWLDGDGEPHSQVFDVAGDPDNGAAVDTATCQTSGNGFDALCATWTDPDFNPAQRAFYYARVIENPVCRWSTYQCNAFAADARPPRCADERIPRTIQERAWSSPIWHRPDTP